MGEFKSEASGFSATNLKNTCHENEWSLSFDQLDGEVKTRIEKQNGQPYRLHISSILKDGSLSIQIAQGGTSIQVPIGDETADLDMLGDRPIVITVSGVGAASGSITVQKHCRQ